MTVALYQAAELAGLCDVPCGTCTMCCQHDAVRILPHEDASKWQTEPHDWMPGARMLAHKPNGDCVYLGEHGCTIQHDKPQICYEMDCRLIARQISWTQARKLEANGQMKMVIWRRGRDLLKERD